MFESKQSENELALTRDSLGFRDFGRCQFAGHLAEEAVRAEYLGLSVGKGRQEPVCGRGLAPVEYHTHILPAGAAHTRH